MMWNYGYDMGWGMWLVMILVVVGVWALVALLIRYAFKAGAPTHPAPPTPLAQLDGRLARGEISPEEYVATRRLLTDGH